MRTLSIAIIALVACLCSCDRDVVYSRFESVDCEAWSRSDTVSFAIPLRQAGSTAQFRVMLRLDPDYEFRNLSLILRSSYFTKKGKTVLTATRTDTLECLLSDSSGRIAGRGVFHRDFSFPLRHTPIADADSMSMVISHNMRRMEIAGVEDIGVEIRSGTTDGR